MRSLHVKLVGLKRHPCKRKPMPFIYAGCKLHNIGQYKFTPHSNALPPFWDKNFDFAFQDGQVQAIDIVLAESRLMMVSEELGTVEIPLVWLPYNYVVAEWIPVKSHRENIEKIELLALFHYCDPNIRPFSQEQAKFSAILPWERREVTQEDIEQVWNPSSMFTPPVLPQDLSNNRFRQQEMQRAMFGSFNFQNSDIPLVEEKAQNS